MAVVREAQLSQSFKDHFHEVYPRCQCLQSLLDVLRVGFLARFTKKLLRFFDMTGTATLGVGAVFLVNSVLERLFPGVPLAAHTALLLGSLLAVPGVHIVALGLSDEMMIYTQVVIFNEYTVDEIVG